MAEQHLALGDTVKALGDSLWIVFQDSRNHYWFGSNGQGVFHYDGKTIVRYTTRHGLTNDSIRQIQEDRSGNIYFATRNGISKFDGQSFVTLDPTPSSDWKLQPNDLWFAGEYGPYRYDGKTLYALKFPRNEMADDLYATHPYSWFRPHEIYFIYKDKKDHIWFGTACMGVYRFDGKNLSWLYEKHLTEPENGGSFGIRSILEDKKGKYLFCNTSYRYNIYAGDPAKIKGINHISYKREKGIAGLKTNDGKNKIYYLSVTEDDAGDLWMVTYAEGVWRYDGKTTAHYPVKNGDQIINTYSVYKDRQGTLWLGTHADGVYRFNGKSFERFRP